MKELVKSITHFDSARPDTALIKSIRKDIHTQIKGLAQLREAGGDHIDSEANFAYLLDALSDIPDDAYTTDILDKLGIIQKFNTAGSLKSEAEAKDDRQQQALEDISCHEMWKAFQHKCAAQKIIKLWPCPPPVTRENQLAHYDNIEKLQKYIAEIKTRLTRMATEDDVRKAEGRSLSLLLFNYMQLGEFLQKLYPHLTARQRCDQLSALIPHFSSPATSPICSEEEIVALEAQVSSLEAKKTANQKKADVEKFDRALMPARRRAREARQPKYKIDVVEAICSVFSKEQPFSEAQQAAVVGLLSCEHLLGGPIGNESPTDGQMSITKKLIAEWGRSANITGRRVFQDIIDAIERDARTLDTPQKRVKGKLLVTNKLQELLNGYFTKPDKFFSDYVDLLHRDVEPARHPLLIVFEDRILKAEASLSASATPFKNWSSILKRAALHSSDDAKGQKPPDVASKEKDGLIERKRPARTAPIGHADHFADPLSGLSLSAEPPAVAPVSASGGGRDMSSSSGEDCKGLREFLQAVEKVAPESKGGAARLAVALEEAHIREMAVAEHEKIQKYARTTKDAGASACADYAADLFHMLEKSSNYTFDYTSAMLGKFLLIYERTSPLVMSEDAALSELYGTFISRFAVQKIARTLPVSRAVSLSDHYANANKLNGYKNAIQNFFLELSSADGEDKDKIEPLVLLCVQMGEFLTKIYPGLDFRNIPQYLPIITPLPNSPPFPNIQDAIRALRMALRDLNTDQARRAMLGLACYERLTGEPSAHPVKQRAVNNSRKLVVQSFLTRLIDTTAERHKFQNSIDAIAKNAQDLPTPFLRIKGKQLAISLQELLNNYFINPAGLSLERVFSQKIAEAEAALSSSSSNATFQDWSNIFEKMMSSEAVKEQKGAMPGLVAQIVSVTPAAAVSTDGEMIELLKRIEKFKNSRFRGKVRMAPIAVAVKDKMRAIAALTATDAPGTHDLTLLASYLLDALPDPSYPYSDKMKAFLLMLSEHYGAKPGGGVVASACSQMYQAVETKLRYKKIAEVWNFPVDMEKSDSEHYANIEKLEKYFAKISQGLGSSDWGHPNTLPQLLLAYIQMGEFLTKLYPPPHTAENIRTQLFRIIPLLPTLPVFYPLRADATDATKKKVAKEIAQMRSAVAVMRDKLKAAAPGSPQAAAAELGLMLHNQLLENPPSPIAFVDADLQLAGAITDVFAGGESGWDASVKQRVAFQEVIDKIGFHAARLKTAKERVTGKELAFKLQTKLDIYFSTANPKTLEENKAFVAQFKKEIQNQEAALSTKFQVWTGIWENEMAGLVRDDAEAKRPSGIGLGSGPGENTPVREIIAHSPGMSPASESKLRGDPVHGGFSPISDAGILEAEEFTNRTFLRRQLPSFNHYFSGPLFRAALFVMLAFAIFSASFLVVPGEFLSGAIAYAPILAVIALAFIVNMAMHWIKSSTVSAIPTCQTVASAEEVQEMLRRYPDASLQMRAIFKKALLVHINNAYELLKGKWQEGLIGFIARGGKTVTDTAPQLLEDYANTLLAAEEQLQENPEGLDPDQIKKLKELKNVFEELETAKVDPTFRPAISKTRIVVVSLLSIALLAGCVTVLAMIFTGVIGIAVTNIAWSLPLMAGLGFFSWFCARYVMNNTSGGHYTQWAALFGVATVTFLTLWAFAAAGFNVGLSGLAATAGLSSIALVGIVAALGFVFVLFAAQALSYARTRGHSERKRHRDGKTYQVLSVLLTGMKVVLAAGFLLLAFLSVAALFNLTGLGIFDNLQSFAYGVISKMAGIGGYEMGTQWFAAFSVGIFATASFIAFELIRSVVEKSPTSAHHFRQQTGRYDLLAGASFGAKVLRMSMRVAPVLFKLGFTISIVIAFYSISAKNGFLPGAEVGLFPIYLIAALVMPLVGGNTRLLPESLKHIFNTWFGLKPLHASEGHWHFVKRELRVAIVLGALLCFALLPGVPTMLALTLLGAGGLATLAFRWGTMLWNASFSPEIHARDYFEASPNIVPRIAPPSDIKNKAVEMHVDYVPAEGLNTYGHIRLRFKFFDMAGGLVLAHSGVSYAFNWTSDVVSYEKFDFSESDALSIKSLPHVINADNPNDAYRKAAKYISTLAAARVGGEQEYDLTGNNCADAALKVVKEFLTATGATNAQQAEMDTLAKGMLTPREMFQGIGNILMEMQAGQSPQADDQAKLKTEIARLDSRIALAQAKRFRTTLQVSDPTIAALKRLKEAALKKLKPSSEQDALWGLSSVAQPVPEAHHGSGHPGASPDFSPRSPSSAITLALSPVSDSSAGGESKSPTRSESPDSPPTPVAITVMPEKKWKRLSFQQGAWLFLFAAVLALALLVFMTTIGGQSLWRKGYAIAFAVLAGSSLLGWSQLNQEPNPSRPKKWLELGLMALGVAGLAALSITALAVPAATLFSPAVILPFMAVIAMPVSYFFGKQGLLENPIETTWRLLAVKNSEGRGKIEQMIGGNSDLAADPDSQQLMLRFLDTAIQAMEHELVVSQKTGDRVIWWGNEHDITTAVGLFQTDVANLKKYREEKVRNNLEASASPTPGPSNQEIADIFNRLKTCRMSADSNTTGKKSAVVLLFATLFIGAVVFVFKFPDIASVLSSASIGGFMIAGLAVMLLALKGVMEWSRQRALSYDEFTGKAKRPSQRITGERLVVWVSNIALFTLTAVMAFLSGVESLPFLSTALVTAAWGVGQLFASRAMQSWLRRAPPEERAEVVEAAASAAGDSDDDDDEESTPGPQNRLSISRVDGLPFMSAAPAPQQVHPFADNGTPSGHMRISNASEEKKPVSARSYFKLKPESKGVVAADLAMNSYFVTAAIMGAVSSQGAYANDFFQMAWNFVGGFGSAPGIYANVKNNWKDAGAREKSLIAFETLVATFLTVTTALSISAQRDSTVFGADNAVMGTLGSYGFALSMTASAARAFNDLLIAWDECSPRFLLDSKLKTYQGMAGDSEEKAQLLREILAIARKKRDELLETGAETLKEIFGKYGFTKIEIQELGLHKPPTAEETQFVETLLQSNEKKCNELLANFLGYLATTICFWLLALKPLNGMSLETFGGGSHVFLMLGGIIKFGQLLASGYNWAQGRTADKLRDEFLVESVRASTFCGEVNSFERAPGSEQVFRKLFDAHPEITPVVEATYRIAYYLHQHELVGPRDNNIEEFLTSLYEDPKKDELLKAALDEFIIRYKGKTQDGHGNWVARALTYLSDRSPSRNNILLGNSMVREKTVTSILKQGLFSSSKAVGTNGGSLGARTAPPQCDACGPRSHEN